MSILECNGVTKSFGALMAVTDVHFKLNKGEILGMIGPNGAGKTTLFNCLIGVEKPNNGTVIFDGKNITGLKPHKVCRLGLAKTSQITEPFRSMTVFENALVGALYGGGMKLKEARPKVRETLEFVGLGPQMTKPASSISVPARRRLELAKVMSSDPSVVLLDENMAGLNPFEIDEALEIIRKIRDAGTSLIVVEHIMRAVMGISDRIIVLNYGAKIAEGTPKDIVANDEVVEAYFGTKNICLAPA